ncbi:MAG: class I tRNA ligase family protein, partial [Deltaproteobacteria bacterium]|nr:class I tRNA ligase family protein [Deltaproteobacteria bacterium]
PEHTTALKTFYPTSVLITGFDIIFFWVARMLMMGLRFMGDVPFKTVYIHALVRDPLGQKMSKSKGNVIDPLELMERFGTDAFRFTLAALAAQGRDIRMGEERVEGYRNFCNKLWNAARFILMQKGQAYGEIEPKQLSLADKWIRHRLQQTIRAVTAHLTEYAYDAAARTLYQFVWREFCDWYIETVKSRLQPQTPAAARAATYATLIETFETLCRLLHPFMPFITEELWQQVQATRDTGHGTRDQATVSPGSIVIAPWPVALKHPLFMREAKTFQLIADVVSAIRTIRSEHRIAPARRIAVVLKTTDPAAHKALGTQGHYLRALARLDRMELRVTPVREGPVAAAVVGPVEIYVPLVGLIDLNAEQVRLQKEVARAERLRDALRAKLADGRFATRAPADIVAEERERLRQAETELEQLRQALTRLAAPPPEAAAGAA